MDGEGEYKRYLLTDDGISPMATPARRAACTSPPA